jgi:hypothetical protein
VTYAGTAVAPLQLPIYYAFGDNPGAFQVAAKISY